MPTKQSDAWLGKTLGQGGRYQLDTLLGYGRSGRVYKALDRKLSLDGTDIYRAVKFLAINLSDRKPEWEKFQRHVQIFTGVRDSHVISVLDYGIASTRTRNGTSLDLPFLVMEYVSAPSLAEILETYAPLPVERTLGLARQIVAAVQSLHSGSGQGGPSSSQLVHGNLTPSNLFVLEQSTGEDWIKVGDFGQFSLLAQLQLPILTSSPQHGSATPVYAAPESFRPEATVDGRADLYGLGCILYQMLTGTSPFGPITTRQTLEQWGNLHQSQPVRPFPKSLMIPSSLETLVQRCLQKTPSSRFSTLKELDRALEQEQQRWVRSGPSPRLAPLDVPKDLAATRNGAVKPSKPPSQSLSSASSFIALVENELLEFIETALMEYDFDIRLGQEGNLLKIGLHRKDEMQVDYAWISQRIAEQVQILGLPEIASLGIESYPPGTSYPDWQAQIVLDDTVEEQVHGLSLNVQRPQDATAGMNPEPLHDLELTEEGVDPDPPFSSDLTPTPDLDLSQYCFVRNQLLLRTSLPTPPPDVAQAIQFFHGLADFDKAKVLPLLTSFFKDPQKTPRDDLPHTLQDWLTGLESLNEQKFKAVAVWLSRYCANPLQTFQEVQSSLSAVVDTAIADRVHQPTGTPASIVRESEPILYQTQPHWVIEAIPWLNGGLLGLLILVIVPTPLSTLVFSMVGVTSETGMANILLRLLLIIPTFLPVLMLIAYQKTSVMLTQSKAVIRRKSLFGERESSEISLEGVSDIDIVQDTLLGALCGGSLSLIRRGQPPQKIVGIRNPQQLKQQIVFLKQQRALGKRLRISGADGTVEAGHPPAGEPVSFPPRSSNRQQDAWLGRVVGDGGRYRLETLIGRGGMGKVYRAQDQKLSINVAIKFMLAGSDAGDDERERFLREMQACINLQDSRIVKVLDYGVTTTDVSGVSSVPFLVMEFISAPTLEAVLRQHPRLPVRRAAVIAQQIAAALQTVHTGVVIHGARVQFIHRDLKPSNVFLLKDSMGEETIKLADFGLVKFQGSISLETLSRTGDFRGTPNYAAPEQCEGRRSIDKRGDIYSLGCMLYEMLSGTNPFGLRPNATPMQWMYAQVNMEPRPFPKSMQIPESLEAIVMRCLAKEPNDRFGTALELSSALNHLVR